MQEQPRQKRLIRIFVFFMSPRGQIFAKWCAYSSLGCLVLGLAFMDYTRLAWPFAIASFFFGCLGMASRSHQRFVQVSAALWIMLVNPLFTGVFDLGTQANQQTRLQQQIIQLENQYNEFEGQKTVLQTFLSSLSFQISQTQDEDQINALQTSLGEVQVALAEIPVSLHYTDGQINYSTWLYLQNFRDLPTTSLINDGQQTIAENNWQIPYNQQNLYRFQQPIEYSNTVLPAEDLIQFSLNPDPTGCVSGFLCLTSYSWGQPFIDGWQHIISEPISATWFFWLLLLFALPGFFLLLPRGIGPLWIVTHRVLYNGPLSNLNDSAFPEQKRQELNSETSVVKIAIRSTRIFVKQKGETDELRELLRLSLEPGTTILDVFLEPGINQDGKSMREVEYDTATGDLVLKVRPTTLVVTSKVSYKALRKLPRSFPIYLYVVVDYFAGSLEATTPVAEIEYLQKQRGPAWFIPLASIFHTSIWWIYAFGFCFCMMMFSTFFFRELPGSSISLLFYIGLGGVAVGCVLWALEHLILRKITRQQRLSSGSFL